MNIASLLHQFQRSLSLDQGAPAPLDSTPDPRFCPRPPTPPLSRRPAKHPKRSTPHERADTAKRVQPDSARSRRGTIRDKDESTRSTDPDEKSHPPSPIHHTSGPLRSILRNKHAGTPYQRLPARHAVRWAAAP